MLRLGRPHALIVVSVRRTSTAIRQRNAMTVSQEGSPMSLDQHNAAESAKEAGTLRPDHPRALIVVSVRRTSTATQPRHAMIVEWAGSPMSLEQRNVPAFAQLAPTQAQRPLQLQPQTSPTRTCSAMGTTAQLPRCKSLEATRSDAIRTAAIKTACGW